MEIVVNILTGVLVPIICAYLGAHWERHPPNIKKIASHTLNFILFSFRYIIPIADLIFLMVTDFPLNKTFVFMIAAMFAVLALNISIELIIHYNRKQINMIKEFEKFCIDVIRKRG